MPQADALGTVHWILLIDHIIFVHPGIFVAPVVTIWQGRLNSACGSVRGHGGAKQVGQHEAVGGMVY
jgi:hypothetical protein